MPEKEKNKCIAITEKTFEMLRLSQAWQIGRTGKLITLMQWTEAVVRTGLEILHPAKDKL